MKKILKIVLGLVLMGILGFAGLVGYLWATEYSPNGVESLKVTKQGASESAKVGTEYTALNWNIGYAGLDKDEDFFMDGGKMVLPLDKAHVEENLKNITEIVKNEKANVNFIQEIDEDSKRSYNINQVTEFDEILGLNSILAYNFKVRYVPYPMPPLGKVKSGIYTATSFNVESARRFQMAIPFTFPERLANLKRGFSVIYTKVENSDKHLVLINAHLDAYDKGNSGKKLR